MSGGHLINDLPDGERPREKMARLGTGALGDDELLAIFLRTGVKGENAIAIGRRLLNTFGGLPGLARAEVAMLAREHGLGIAKACQLAAAFELGKRLARRQLDRLPLGQPDQIAAYMGPQMQHLRTESLRVIVLDNRLRCLTIEEITIGSSNQTLAMPRDVTRPLLLHQATQFAVVHNHPSGDPTPSQADFRFTNDLLKAAALMDLTLADHVIIGHPAPDRKSYYSFAEYEKLTISKATKPAAEVPAS
jgi:DNA repair protein RadC